MIKEILLACGLALSISAPSYAQMFDPPTSTAEGGATAWSNGQTQGNFRGPSIMTTSNGANSPFLPGLAGMTTSSGAPFPGSFRAPGNLALKVQGGGSSLPQTRLDSFVKTSGYNDEIYGDEGTDDKPPLTDFQKINSGISSGQLTTGHKSDAPSAWDKPN